MADEKTRSPATVQKHADWHLVTYGSWQVSVGPDGLIMLPRHLHHREVDEFVGCLAVAKDVAATVVAGNESRANALKEKAPLSARQAIVTQGAPPPGTMRMQVASAQQRSASIGRGKGAAGGHPAQNLPARPGGAP